MPLRLLAPRQPLPLFDAAATRALERSAAAALPAHELMRRAGRALTRLARAVAPHARCAWIAAGPGNNGGDGLVLASALHAAGVEVHVTLVGHAAEAGRAAPADAAWALAEAHAAGVRIASHLPTPDVLARLDLAVDALLGVGQDRAPGGAIAEAVRLINECGAPVLAVDTPTGLATDTGALLGDDCVRATHTLTLLTPKPGLFTGSGREQAGEIWFDALGCDAPDPGSATELAGREEALALLPPRRHQAHKGSFGDVHIAGGAAGMVGAALLAGHAASVAGAGRVLVHTHASDGGGPLPVDVGRPELMLRPVGALQPALRENPRATVVAGCGGGDDVARDLPGILAGAGRLVLDADALNAIARDEALREQLRHRGGRGLPTVLTPHPLEAARLLATTVAVVQSDRLAAARLLARSTGCVVVLKGSGTVIAIPSGRATINPTGNSRLATAGTGDVLAGWLGGLWAAQPHAAGNPAADDLPLAAGAAIAASYVHGLACEFAPGTRLPLVASALVEAIAGAVHALR
jgi:hydroxyethylthiazole kinase-like uncharacterized protein yjeF